MKARLSSYLKQVKTGNELVITERGEPVGRIIPFRPSVEERMQELAKQDVAERWKMYAHWAAMEI